MRTVHGPISATTRSSTVGSVGLLLLLTFLNCGPAAQDAASEGTTARRCEGQPVITAAEGGVFITYCGATTFAPTAQIAGHAPWAARQK